MRINKLIFPLTESLVARYSNAETSDLFEGDNLIVYCLPSDYRPVFEQQPELRQGFSSFYGNIPGRTFIGFEANLTDNRGFLYYLLKDLQALQGDGLYVTPTTVLDYCHPDTYEAEYTTRTGLLSVQSGSGMTTDMKTGSDRYLFGLSIIFQQISAS